MLENQLWMQEIDYKQIPFKCGFCHQNGHFANDCSLWKSTPCLDPSLKEEDGFVHVQLRGHTRSKRRGLLDWGETKEIGSKS